VDLTARTIKVEKTLEKYDKFWGGNGMAYKVLWDETDADTGPYDAKNRLIFGWGPLAGTGTPCGGRTGVTALGPQHPHGAPTTGHMGGHFSSEAKYAGWDGIIVQGIASGPVYIACIDDKVEIVDCPELWGEGIYRITAEIQQSIGGGQVVAIGQAGQNQAAQATILTGYGHSGGGQGGVMGSKNLVGIGVIGTGAVKIAGDKRAWRAVVDNAMALVGSNNQAVVPNNLQAWAEHSPSSARWYCAPGRFWGAANPPVDTGICLPRDRQRVGYRCYKTDTGTTSYPYTIRMNGCHSCPVRCHQLIDIPSATVKWGIESTAQNTCTGWWATAIASVGDGAMSGVAGSRERTLWSLERYVMAKHVVDDFGIHNNYGSTQALWNLLINSRCANPTVASPTVSAATNATIASGSLSTIPYNGRSFVQLNVPTAEYNSLVTGFLTQRTASNLGCLQEFGRIVSEKKTMLGRAVAGPVEECMDTWYCYDHFDPAASTSSKIGVILNATTNTFSSYWRHGFPQHHYNQGGYVGYLYSTGYNRDPQNHTWVNCVSHGLPAAVTRGVADVEFPRVGWTDITGGSSIQVAGVDTGTGVNYAPAKGHAASAAFCIARKEIHDGLGICNWMWPWLVSPLKERGYRGDLSLESQFFSLATGNTLSTVELDQEGLRFYHLHRALTMRMFGPALGKDMRTNNDFNPVWTRANFSGNRWNDALDLYYDFLGYDSNGRPKQQTMVDFGLEDVYNDLVTAGFYTP